MQTCIQASFVIVSFLDLFTTNYSLFVRDMMFSYAIYNIMIYAVTFELS